MKSTVKIDYQVRNNGGISVIKIVQPIELTKTPSPEDDIDPRDTMVSQFIQSPLNINPNRLFEASSYYPHPFENPTHYITNVEPIPYENILNRLEIHLTGLVELLNLDFDKGKIMSFFDSLNNANKINKNIEKL